MKKIFVLLVMLVFILGCTLSPQTNNEEDVAQTVSAIVFIKTAVVQTVEAKTAIVPGQTSTLTEETKEETPEIREINERIKAFLKGTGDYSEEKLYRIPHLRVSESVELTDNYLGIMETVSWVGDSVSKNQDDWSKTEMTQVFFQGLYLGGLMKDNRVILFVGMKDKKGKRIMVPIGRNVYPDAGDSMINSLNVNEYDGGAKTINSGFSNLDINVNNFSLLEKRYSEVVVFDCIGSEIRGAIKERIMSVPWPNINDGLNESNMGVPLCGKLYNDTVDLRVKKGALLNNVNNEFFIYNEDMFISIEEIIGNLDSDVVYDMIRFVRP